MCIAEYNTEILMYLLPDPEPYLNEDLESNIRDAISSLLVPRDITSEVVIKYVRKALRLGVWRRLAPETKALLLVCRRLVRLVRSRTLAQILSDAFLRIELAGLRGRALFYGAIEFVRRSLGSLEEVPFNAKKVLCLGIAYLNNPPMLRLYG